MWPPCQQLLFKWILWVRQVSLHDTRRWNTSGESCWLFLKTRTKQKPSHGAERATEDERELAGWRSADGGGWKRARGWRGYLRRRRGEVKTGVALGYREEKRTRWRMWCGDWDKAGRNTPVKVSENPFIEGKYFFCEAKIQNKAKEKIRWQ